MRKLSVALAVIIFLALLSGCSGQKQDYCEISDIKGTWYSTSDDESTVMFDANGSVKIEGHNMGSGIYTYDSGEMEGMILIYGWIPRFYMFYYFLDDTLSFSNQEYARKNIE